MKTYLGITGQTFYKGNIQETCIRAKIQIFKKHYEIKFYGDKSIHPYYTKLLPCTNTNWLSVAKQASRMAKLWVILHSKESE